MSDDPEYGIRFGNRMRIIVPIRKRVLFITDNSTACKIGTIRASDYSRSFYMFNMAHIRCLILQKEMVTHPHVSSRSL